MNRLEANRRILQLLRNEIELQPDIRFCQLLSNLDIVERRDHEYDGDHTPPPYWVDEFNTESVGTLQRILNALNRTGAGSTSGSAPDS